MPWAVAAAAVAAGGAYAASDNAKKGAQGPASLKAGRKQAMDRASEIADRPYTPYSGNRVAGLSNNELQASRLAGSSGQQVQSDLDQSRSEIGKSTQDFNAENLNKYMNPYLDTAYKAQNEAYDTSKSALLNSKAGAWGGDRAAFSESELDRTHRDSLAKISYDAYNAATGAFFNDADRHARAAAAWRESAGDTANMNRQQIQDLMATGGLERTLRQAQLDFNYDQFVEERDWDITNLQPLLASIGVNNNAPGKPNNEDSIATALGAAATVAGAYFSANPSTTKTPTTTSTTSTSAQAATAAGVS